MSTVLSPVAPIAPVLSHSLYRLTVAQYHAMSQQGILKSGDPIELLEGLLVRKMTINQPHRYATQYLRDLLPRMMPVGWFVDDQSPITTSDSEPEPDIALIRGDRRQYLVQNRNPGPADTALLIEVSDSSLADDRTTKGRIYARASIPLYWIVNVIDRQVEVYSDPIATPGTPSYQHRQDFVPGDQVPIMLDGQEVGRVVVAELFV